ncbi:MAG: sugar ABC transporter permease [Provencibacterium sp.]|jgi:putative aldouronate transport system permease protein|nr:sugar ABC transporter permease [Provencibacterium sp.]
MLKSAARPAKQASSGAAQREGFFAGIRKDFRRNRLIYLMILPVLIYYLVFHYFPMYGATIAFKDFNALDGITGSPWVGFKHFNEFFSSFYFWRLLKNTVLLSAYGLVFSFPMPIVLALLLNEVRHNGYKRVVQTITYIPHFISIVVICGMIIDFVKQDGVITHILTYLGMENNNLLLEPGNFRSIYIISDIWQQIGWNSIIYLAALTGIDTEMFEAARIDGAGKLRQIISITIPSILPTIVIMLILKVGTVMNIGFEKVMLLYNASIYETADVISTFVYRRGILEAAYSYSAAVGLFNSVINCTLVIVTNKFSKKFTETSLW